MTKPDTITLITGANRSLGYTTAQRLLAKGHKVYVAARDRAKGAAAAKALGAQFLRLDVDDDAAVEAAAKAFAEREARLDVLINNAGISGPRKAVADFSGADAEAVFRTNVAGIVRMTCSFLPLLQKSKHPRIVNVSRGMGSLALIRDPKRAESKFVAPLYSSSKSAVVMLTAQYARALPGIKINAADPGYTATDFNGHTGYQTVQEGTDAIVQLATIGKDGPTGVFIDRFGPVAW
jgi:NAD(P)-dependent dehydrogenase (short-subunit alcohol dehydrogenase family)